MTHRVLIRADAGTQIGAGHVVRSLALADELQARGCSITFVTNSPADIVTTLRTHGHRVSQIKSADRVASAEPGAVWSSDDQRSDAEATRQAVGDSYDTVIVDHYGLDARWEESVAGDRRVLVLDDLANRRHHCSVLCDQNWYGPHTENRYDGLVDSDCRLLLGPRYAVLQAAYRQLSISRPPITWPPTRVLVSFGGTDPGNETEKALDSLADLRFRHLHVDVVVGSPARVTARLERKLEKRPRSNLHVGVPSLAPLLARCDLAIGASGAGTWERLCLGVPAFVATSSPHQSGVTEALATSGLTDWVGLTADTDVAAYDEALTSLLSRPKPTIPRVVDGFGTARLAETLFPTPPDELAVRPARPADIAALAGIEGEYRGVGADLLDGPATWESESLKLATMLNDPHSRPLVVELAGVPVGGIWFDRRGRSSILLQLAVQHRQLEADIQRLLDRASQDVGDP